MPGEVVKGPGPALRALGTKTVTTRGELQHPLQLLAFFVVYVNLTEKASRFLVDPKALQSWPY